jgi:hypothetical protein
MVQTKKKKVLKNLKESRVRGDEKIESGEVTVQTDENKAKRC